MRVIQVQHIGQRQAAVARAVSATGRPAGPSKRSTIRTDRIYVIYTSYEETRAALRVAWDFGDALHVPITVVHFRTVPYPLAVERPDGISPVESEAFAELLRSERMQARRRVYLCRREHSAFSLAFKPHSLIVVGGQHHWWPNAVDRMRKRLEADGHFVLLVDPSREDAARVSHVTDEDRVLEESTHA